MSIRLWLSKKGVSWKSKKKNKLFKLYFKIKALQEEDHNDLEEVWEAIEDSNTNIIKLKDQV